MGLSNAMYVLLLAAADGALAVQIGSGGGYTIDAKKPREWPDLSPATEWWIKVRRPTLNQVQNALARGWIEKDGNVDEDRWQKYRITRFGRLLLDTEPKPYPIYEAEARRIAGQWECDNDPCPLKQYAAGEPVTRDRMLYEIQWAKDSAKASGVENVPDLDRLREYVERTMRDTLSAEGRYFIETGEEYPEGYVSKGGP
jgi:hypothetical protein